MGHWNYRVMRKGESHFIIVEAYYNDKNEIYMWSENAIAPQGEDLRSLTTDINYITRALEKPIIIEIGDGKVKEWIE
jgi:hypothetical protein